MSLREKLGVGLIVAGGAVLLAQRAISALREKQARRPRTPHGNVPPTPLHKVLPPSVTACRRVIVVGDIHGCPDELQALLDKVGYQKGVDILLSVGDLVNKGPDSERVIRMAIESGMQATRGNHDDSAYEAFRCWLDGRDIPKPKKQGWVAGLDEQLAAFLNSLPYTLQLPAYGVVVVHAGLVPGMPLEQQGMEEMEKLRDVVPATEAAAADAAAAALAAGADTSSLPVSSFGWEAAGQALAALAVEGKDSTGRHVGRCGSSMQLAGSEESGGAASGAESDAAGREGLSASLLPPELQLLGREVPNPLGRAWASIWKGPPHVLFGHDAKRRLQLCTAATGLDTGCVYGGQLTAAVLPPLDEQGQPLLQRLNLPPDAQEFKLCSGLPAFLVQVPARVIHSDKFLRREQQVKGDREEAA